MPTTRAHKFYDTQPTTSFALLSIQLVPAFIPNRPNRDANALSLFLIHPFKPFSSLGGNSPPPPEIAPHSAIMLQLVPRLPFR